MNEATDESVVARVAIEKKPTEGFVLRFEGPDVLIVAIAPVWKPTEAVRLQFVNASTGEVITMLKMSYTQQVSLEIEPVDAAGHPAEVDGAPFWSLSNEAVGHLEVDPDNPLFALFIASAPGTTQVNVSADADLGDGTRTITGLLDVEVLAGEAVSLGITAGTPDDQQPAPPQRNAKKK